MFSTSPEVSFPYQEGSLTSHDIYSLKGWGPSPLSCVPKKKRKNEKKKRNSGSSNPPRGELQVKLNADKFDLVFGRIDQTQSTQLWLEMRQLTDQDELISKF